jgi:hypothetical protein
MMAGMIACLWQAYPAKTNQEIKQLVIKSADRFTIPNNQYGYGIPDFNLALNNGLLLNTFSKDDFIIYPNPTSDFVSILLPKSIDRAIVTIYTILGQKVLDKEITAQSASISLKALNKGMYIYKVESNSFSKSGKIIKR